MNADGEGENNLQELLVSLYHTVLGIELGSAELGNKHPLSDEPSRQSRIQANTPSWCYIPSLSINCVSVSIKRNLGIDAKS